MQYIILQVYLSSKERKEKVEFGKLNQNSFSKFVALTMFPKDGGGQNEYTTWQGKLRQKIEEKDTWQAKTSWIVDLETCFAVAARTFPSVPSFNAAAIVECFPFVCLKMQLFTCMTVLAASQSDPMTEATSCAAETKPWDHWLSSLPCGEEEDRGKGFGRFHLFCTSSHFSFRHQHLLGCSCCTYQRRCGFCN